MMRIRMSPHNIAWWWRTHTISPCRTAAWTTRSMFIPHLISSRYWRSKTFALFHSIAIIRRPVARYSIAMIRWPILTRNKGATPISRSASIRTIILKNDGQTYKRKNSNVLPYCDYSQVDQPLHYCVVGWPVYRFRFGRLVSHLNFDELASKPDRCSARPQNLSQNCPGYYCEISRLIIPSKKRNVKNNHEE